MKHYPTSLLPLGSGIALAVALVLGGCGSKKDQSVAVPAANSSAPLAAANAADTSPADGSELDGQTNDQDMRARHHQQEMDHDAMRHGPHGRNGPSSDPSPANQAAPMTDM